jgi:signal transduction histidine kinase
MPASPLLPRGGVTTVLTTFSVAALVLLWTTARDIRSGTRRVEQVMLAQAESIADLVSESASHGFATYRLWEDEIAARLLDNARWIAARDSISPLTSRELERLAFLHSLGRINLFDASGGKVASSHTEEDLGIPARHEPRDYIGPVLDGRVREMVIGFKPARFRGGSRFAVAVHRHGGGAVVVNVFADSIEKVLESVQPGHLVRGLGSASGVRYVLLAHADSVLAASPERPSGRISSPDPATRRLRPGDPALVREIRTGSYPVYEVARAIPFPGLGSSVVRVGLDPEPLDRARADLRARGWSRAVVLLAVTLLVTFLLLVWQRHGILRFEFARVRGELEARQLEAERAARLRAMGEMAAHVAHEIRNPLNTIHLTAQQMSRDPTLDEETRLRAADLHAESARIEGIVQQFLEVARPRRPQPQPLDLGQAVAAAGRAAGPLFEAAGRQLEVDTESLQGAADPIMLDQILENLLRNALEATAPGGRTRLAVRREGDWARIVVEDDGPGVPTALKERIFDLYFTTKPQGTGLGLTLVAQMAAAMGGTVRVEDRAGGGARFVVRLPLKEGA